MVLVASFVSAILLGAQDEALLITAQEQLQQALTGHHLQKRNLNEY